MGWTRVVVGVDGSPCSARALTWAAHEARLHGAELSVVTSYTLPLPPADGGYATPHWAGEEAWRHRDQLRENAEWLQRTTISHALGDHSGLAVDADLIEGTAAQALLDATKDADLLVVGTRGHGGFTGMLLASVSQHVVSHAACPVTVVR